MTRRQRPTRDILTDALEHLEVVVAYGAGDVRDQKTLDAICMRLSAGIEVLNGLDDATRERVFGDSWAHLWGMRNRIALPEALPPRRQRANGRVAVRLSTDGSGARRGVN